MPVAKTSPGKETSLAAAAYEAIKDKIITLHFLPGQYLNESAISDLLGLGRTPVHQALQRLHLERLVEVLPRKGVVVLPDSIAEVIKILDSRATVEPELARNAAEQVTLAEFGALQALATTAETEGGEVDLALFTERDRAFHRKIGEMSGNPIMADFARMLHERSTRYWYLHLWQTIDVPLSNGQHSAIALAIGRGDGETAAAAMRDHIDGLRGRLTRILTRKAGADEKDNKAKL